MLDPGVPDLTVLPSLHKLGQVEKENLNKQRKTIYETKATGLKGPSAAPAS